MERAPRVGESRAGVHDVLESALGDDEPLVREHAAWALDAVRARGSAD